MAAPKRGLGKGLSALIPAKAPAAPAAAAVHPEGVERHLRVADIRPNRFQPRHSFRDETLAELMQSIREKGVIEPVIVRRVGGGYELIAGERRLRAVQKLGLAQIPAIVRQATDQEALELALIENIQRENLNPMEEARGYERLQKEFLLTQDGLARKVGKERSTVANSLRLLMLPVPVQKLLEDDKLTAGHARAILMITDPARQISAAREIVAKGYSVREAEALARGEGGRGSSQRAAARKARNLDQYLATIQGELQRALGTKVRLIVQGKEKGKIEIEYYSNHDFERILKKLDIKL
ncbi:MAG: ParB/RepB/Spo0J family partition protein [Candidatus Edwardsbacteria bacterium]|jgi:ParB family chromosome partitioning protein|nr:ParB/RepB/Spo0J family partition protein [Candidatus Edwardsbacteria bacterium]